MNNKSFRSFADWITCWLFGFDFFVSYSWEDGKEYATGLWGNLTSEPHRFTCFLDERCYVAGEDLRISPERALRHTSVFVLIASSASLKSADVQLEAKLFADARMASYGKRTVVVVDPDGAFRNAPKRHPIRRAFGNILYLRDNVGVLGNAPPQSAVDAVARSLKSVRRSVIRTRIVNAVGLFLCLLLAATTIFAFQAERARRKTVEILAEALASAARDSAQQGLGERARNQLQSCAERHRFAEWRSMKARLPTALHTLNHKWWCQKIAPGPESGLVITAGRDDGLLIWNTSQAVPKMRQISKTENPNFAQDASTRFLAESPDGTNIVVWAADNATSVANVQPGSKVTAFSLTPQGHRLAWACSKQVHVCDLKENITRFEESLPFEILSLAYGGKDGGWLLARGPAGAAILDANLGLPLALELPASTDIAKQNDLIVSVEEGALVRRVSPIAEPELVPLGGGKSILSLSNSGKYSVIEKERDTLSLVRSSDGQTLLDRRIPQTNPSYAHAFSADEKWFACEEGGGRILLYSLVRTNRAGVVFAHESRMNSLAFSADGALLYSACDDGSAKTWDVESLRNDEVIPFRESTFDAQPGSIALSPNGRFVFLANGQAGGLTVCDITKTALDYDALPNAGFVKAGIRNGTAWCVLTGAKPGIYHYDHASGRAEWRMEGGGFLCVSRDEKIASCVSARGHPAFFDLATGGLIREYAEISGPPAHGVVMSPDGKWLVLHEDYEDIKVLCRTRSVTRKLALPGSIKNPGIAFSLAISDDSRLLAVGFAFGELWIFRLDDGSILHKLKAFDYHVTGLSFSDADRRLVSLSSTGALQYWDVASGRCVASDQEREFSQDAWAHYLLKDTDERVFVNTDMDGLRIRRMEMAIP